MSPLSFPLAYAGGSLGALSRSTPAPDHLPATNTARFAARAATRQLAEAAAFDALSNLEGVHLGGARRRDVGAVLMASLGSGLRGAFGFRLLRSRFRGAHRGGCRFRLADDLGRHRRRRCNGCWGHRFGANPFSRRQKVDTDAFHPSVAAGRRVNAIECRRFAPPDNGLRGASFRTLSPQPMQTIGEIVPDILNLLTGRSPQDRYDPGTPRIKGAAK